MASEVQQIPLIYSYSCAEDGLIISRNKSHSTRSIEFPHDVFYKLSKSFSHNYASVVVLGLPVGDN